MSTRKPYSPEFKFQVVIEALTADSTNAEVARAYDVHPVTPPTGNASSARTAPRSLEATTNSKEGEEDRQAGTHDRQEGGRDRPAEEFFGRALTTSEKVDLAGQHKDTYGLSQCLEALDLAKSTYCWRLQYSGPSQDDLDLMHHIRAIIREHPDYGYRRILPDLRERTGRRINHKRLRRLLSDYELGLPRSLPKHSPSPVERTLKEAAGSLNLIEDLEEPEFWRSSSPTSPSSALFGKA